MTLARPSEQGAANARPVVNVVELASQRLRAIHTEQLRELEQLTASQRAFYVAARLRHAHRFALALARKAGR